MKTFFKSQFSKKIYEARNNSNLTIEEAAFRIGVAPRTLRYYESGQKMPRFYTVVKIAKTYNISIDELV